MPSIARSGLDLKPGFQNSIQASCVGSRDSQCESLLLPHGCELAESYNQSQSQHSNQVLWQGKQASQTVSWNVSVCIERQCDSHTYTETERTFNSLLHSSSSATAGARPEWNQDPVTPLICSIQLPQKPDHYLLPSRSIRRSWAGSSWNLNQVLSDRMRHLKWHVI